jgi:quercetin dioxygenase-like cupin family protein
MSAQPLVVTPKNRPQPLLLVGEQVTVLIDGATTGNFEIFHQDGPEGAGAVPHHHPWHEAFYVLAGQIAFGIGGADADPQLATPGTFVFIPAGSTHWFRFSPGGAQMLSMTSQPGVAEFFADVHRQVGPAEPDLAILQEVAAAHRVTVLPAAS